MNSAFRRIAAPARRFAHSSTAQAAKEGRYQEKGFKEAWLSDVGSYPVIASIALGCAIAGGAMTYFLLTRPDSRITDQYRKSLFRGDLSKEYQNPVKGQESH